MDVPLISSAHFTRTRLKYISLTCCSWLADSGNGVDFGSGCDIVGGCDCDAMVAISGETREQDSFAGPFT